MITPVQYRIHKSNNNEAKKLTKNPALTTLTVDGASWSCWCCCHSNDILQYIEFMLRHPITTIPCLWVIQVSSGPSYRVAQ